MENTFQPKLTGIYIGIDPSLKKTGLVCIKEDGELVETTVVKTTAKDRPEERLPNIATKMLEFIVRNKPNMVGIEAPAYAKQSNKAHLLGALHFYLRIRLAEEGIGFEIVGPGTWKKAVLGKGNLHKDLILLETYKKYNISFSSDDLCDAYCIAKYVSQKYPSTTKRKLVKRK